MWLVIPCALFLDIEFDTLVIFFGKREVEKLDKYHDCQKKLGFFSSVASQQSPDFIRSQVLTLV